MIRFLRTLFGGYTPTVPISLLPGDPPPMPPRPPFPVVDYPMPDDLKGLVSVALRCGGPREQLRALNGPCLRVAEALRLPECVFDRLIQVEALALGMQLRHGHETIGEVRGEQT